MTPPDDLTPETLRSITRQIADGIEDPEVAIALLEVGDKHASVWEARIEALEKALRECLDHLDVENMTTQEVERRARTALRRKEER